jgi:glycosyltransferase involved in cell wall biosynthesis
MTIRLAIVVPCFNEEAVLGETMKQLGSMISRLHDAGKVTSDSGVYFVDDGSKDSTWQIICTAAESDSRMHGYKLSRNQGHQSALLAGLTSAPGDAIVSIDADLQDDVTAIERMVDLHMGGADIVSGVRRKRATDTRFKRTSAELYYRLLGMLGVQIIFNHADFRLMSRRAVDALQSFAEVNLFLRGIIPLLGFNCAIVYYDRGDRFAGTSKYPLRKMLGLAINGVTSFSVAPLRFIAGLGLLISLASMLMIGWALYGKLVLHTVLPGWASSIIPIYLLGGVQLFSVGIIGEYIGKIYLEVKRRPRFFIESETR